MTKRIFSFHIHVCTFDMFNRILCNEERSSQLHTLTEVFLFSQIHPLPKSNIFVNDREELWPFLFLKGVEEVAIKEISNNCTATRGILNKLKLSFN